MLSTPFTQFSPGSATDSLGEHLLYVFNILLSPYSVSPHYPFLLPRNSLCLGMELQSVHYVFSTAPSSSHSSPPPVCGLSRGRQCSSNYESFPQAAVLHELHLDKSFPPGAVPQEQQVPLMKSPALTGIMFQCRLAKTWESYLYETIWPDNFLVFLRCLHLHYQ